MKLTSISKIISFSLALAALISACETVIDLEVPIEKPKLVVKGTFDSYGNWNFAVTKSMHILDVALPKVYDSAVITVFQGESKLFTVPPGFVPGSYYHFSGPVPPGKEYRITVEVPKMETVLGSTVSPNLPNLVNINYDSTTTIVDHGGWKEEYKTIEITFKDDINKEDFYQLSMEAFRLPPYYNPDMPPPDSIWEELYIRIDDPVVKVDDDMLYVDGRMLFSDFFINGKEYTLKLMLDWWNFEFTGKVRICFSTVTKDGFLFSKTLRDQQWARGDPFSEPVNVHSNIENGYGIFYGTTTDTLEINLK